MSAVTSQHIESYQRDGVVLIENVFSRYWIDELTAAFDRVVALGSDPAYDLSPVGMPGSRPLTLVRSFGDLTVLNMPAHDEAFRRWITDSPAAEICGEIAQSRTMRFWTDATFEKDTTGETNGTPWHNDYCTWPFWGEQMPILWMPLTDVGMEDAPLQTLLGSHTEPHRYYSWLSPEGLGSNDMYHPWQELLDKVAAPGAPIKAWTLKAGDCLVMHPKTIHSSLPRTTTKPGRRLAFSTRWLGDDSIWAPDDYCRLGLAPEVEAQLPHGQPPSPAIYPIVWRKERERELA